MVRSNPNHLTLRKKSNGRLISAVFFGAKLKTFLTNVVKIESL
jgi:hypothetical protein